MIFANIFLQMPKNVFGMRRTCIFSTILVYCCDAKCTRKVRIIMEKIASFRINHDTLMPGMYVSRVDGDVITYDVRFVRPNTPPYLPTAAMHTIEHLVATFVRNSTHKDGIIYWR